MASQHDKEGKKKFFILSVLSFTMLVILALSAHSYTPVPVQTDPLIRMPGTQPAQGVVLNPPGNDETNGCLNCHGEWPTDVQGNVTAPGWFWQGSMMAQAARDPVFLATMTVAAQDSIWLLGNPNAVDLCLRCHFPQGWLGGRSGHNNPGHLNASAMTGSDFDGVHCDACHRMWDPFFKTTHNGTREGSDWLGYWDEAEQTSPGSQASADQTFDEDKLLSLGILLLSNGPFYDSSSLPPATYHENAGGQYFVSLDNTPNNFQLQAKLRASFADTEPDHSVLYSRYHKSRFFCSNCHDVSNSVLANLGHENDPVLPTEANSAYSYGHVERTFSEFAISAYGRQGGAPTNPEFQAQGAPSITIAAKCQDCHMDDIVGKGCRETAAPLRPDESLEHPNSGAPFHNLQGGNAWITYILGSTDDHFPEYDQVNFDLLNQGPAALTLDLNQGIDIRDNRGTLLHASQRAEAQLKLAATIKGLSYDSATGDLFFRIQNNTAHKLLSGYPEGRRMFVNIKAYNATNELIFEVNPYAYTIGGGGSGGTLKGLTLATSGISPALGVNEVHRDDLVYEVKPMSSVTGETKTFHFVLADGRFKDNRIPPKGFDIAAAPERIVEPARDGSSAMDLFTSQEYLGGYDDVALNGVLPAAAARVEVTLHYQGTSREYIQFLRDEINGTINTTLGTPPSEEPSAYIVQTEPFFAGLKQWGNTVWSLWKHNHGFTLEESDVPTGLADLAGAPGGPPVAGIVPYEMAKGVWPDDASDVVTITKAAYNATTQTLTVLATSSAQPNGTLTVVGHGKMSWNPTRSLYQRNFSPVTSAPESVTVTSSGGGSVTQPVPYPPADVVTITKAAYNATTQTLTVLATSSAQPNGTLTAVGHGKMSWNPTRSLYQRNFSPVTSAPESVTVTSSLGGSAIQDVPFP